MIPRIITSQITSDLNKGKAIIILGPRRVGKTTLIKSIESHSGTPSLFLNCDEPDIRPLLENVTSSQLKFLIGNNKLVLIDEAQRIKNIGITLKLLVDNFKDIQVIASGSSALELANEINEPLTGRKKEYHLFPISTGEMVNNSSVLEEKRMLEQRLIYGFYPDIINNPDDATESLLELSSNYLYKDILSLESIRKPALLENLLIALALQIGNEVSYNELGQLLNSDPKTVENYINLLEKCFVIFQLSSFSRNLRNEIKKGKKIYFYDNGIRNAIIKNFNPIQLRQDIGALWENFLMAERVKSDYYKKRLVNRYFWRTRQQHEIDLVEETGGKLLAWEFKWNEKSKSKVSPSFLLTYPEASGHIINKENYLNFLT